MAHRIIANERDRSDFLNFVARLKLPATFEWTLGRDRSAQQNRLMWLWASEVEQQVQQETADEVQRRWKLDIGIPLLCESSEDYRQFCRLTLGRLSYEQRKEAMKFTPVTSELKLPQMIRFLDTIERECAEQGIRLTAPDAELSKYHDRYRGNERKAA